MSPTRWRTPAVVVGLALAALGYVWLGLDGIAQAKVMLSFGIAMLAALALLAWFLFGSGLPRRARILGLTLAALSGGAFFALVRIRGVTGDLVPVVEPRWRPKEAAAAPRLPPVAVRPAPPDAPIRPESAPSRPPRVASASPPAGAADAAPAGADSGHADPATAASAATLNDYPQFLGPNRDGTVPGVRLLRDWSKRPPRLVWRQPIGLGWSAFSIAGTRAVTQEQRGPDELVTAYDLLSGRPLWAHADRVRFDSVIAGDGPRAAPTIAAGRVFTMGSTGLLNALELASGRRLWSHDVVGENGSRVPDFGKVSSPLVVGDLVVVSAGGGGGRSLVAYRGDTGEPVWSAGDDASGYGSPALVTLLGQPQVLVFNQGSVAGHDPASGRLLWQHAWPRTQPNVAQPLPLSRDRVLFSAGYGVGAKLFQLAAAGEDYSARLVWETPRLKAKFVNMVLVDGFVYGLDDGVLVCLDPETGERRWKAGRYGHGQMLLVGGTLVVQTEDGELVLLEPSRDGLRELARFRVLDGKTWNPPALAAPYLVVRNDTEAACYELALER